MMNPDLQEVDTIIESAIEALKNGDSVNVTRLARQVASIDPESEVAWLLLATVASPADSLAFVQQALLLNPDSAAALEALQWAQGRLPAPPAEESLIAMDALRSSGFESGSPAEAPELPLETASTPALQSTELQEALDPSTDVPAIFDEALSTPALQSIELQEALEPPAVEPFIFDEALTTPTLQSIELQEALEPPADEPAVFDAIFPPAVETTRALETAPGSLADEPGIPEAVSPPTASSFPDRDRKPEPSAGRSAAIPERPEKTKWTFPTSAPDQYHEPIRRSSLSNSRTTSLPRKKKTVFSSMLLFLASASTVVGLAAVLSLLFLRSQLTSLWQGFIPVTGCQSSLAIGAHTYQVRSIQPDSDGNYAIPANQPGRAYYVEGTSSNYVFFLSPVSENLTFMTGLPTGEAGTVTWSNCNTNSYHLFQPLAQILNMPALLDQSLPGITIILPWSGSTSGFVLKGTPQNILLPVTSTPDAALATLAPEATPEATPEETAMPVNTPDYSELLAEISLLETIPSADLTTIRVGISIYNYGQLAGTLTNKDVSLTPQGGTALALLHSEPALPLELAPGATRTIYLTFPRPVTATATL
jgi:hypothetical protein